MRLLFASIILATLSSPLLAQHSHHGSHSPSPSPAGSPYAEFRTRTIKTLSAQQIDDLRAGRGMGLALAAELNSYPGPMHVLEHEQALGLTAGQKTSLNALMVSMRADAIKAGQAMIESESALDRLFADGKANNDALNSAVFRAAQAAGEVRLVHLRTHILVKKDLTPEQITTYNRLRGYVGP